MVDSLFSHGIAVLSSEIDAAEKGAGEAGDEGNLAFDSGAFLSDMFHGPRRSLQGSCNSQRVYARILHQMHSQMESLQKELPSLQF